MQRAIWQCSEEEEDEGAERVVEELIETLLEVIIQNRLSSPSALKLAEAALRETSLKPLIEKRLLQSTIQHPHFFKLSSSPSSTRDDISLLHTLFHLHPTNTCQITHIKPLNCVYCGTLFSAISIFQLFELTRKLYVSQLFGRWSAMGNGEESGKALDAVLSLDAGVVLKTRLNFPRWRRLEFDTNPLPSRTSGGEEQLYDPVFLILLFNSQYFPHLCPCLWNRSC
ncbi:uncharacterized protein LACBIDRAFT_305619 [Laccaria bicolor S238N-H82]|uniref:Predicted protein n=1 Tax=Laccaria bicolor (strain S238N-H82 / ATCC MYA-4686) TaxID=486041 RepID=B0CUN7_LACBS|nr:uncharacterized protein LACBIDRAFT_305619 [Laccaria bicolor S238N-H82]EDR14703.1 predicted protein [Laccaria bicolor S238N-H82]|eukprot:XP_001875262.1 predicted protein [Laccaria bicolor S238N-H82]